MNGGERLQRTVASASDVESLSPRDRALLAAWLARSAECDDISLLPRTVRLAGLGVLVGGVVLLIPWIAGLSMTLPADHSSHQWRLAWSGFDFALSLAFAYAAFAGWRRRQLAVTALTLLGVLLLCDAWFDVTLSWGTSEQTASILTALFAELPVAMLARSEEHTSELQ